MAYSLRTFGGLDLRDAEGEPVEAALAHSKGMALLVYLAVEVPEEGLDRGRATALLWPDREESRARNALSITLTRLRRATELPLIEGKGERILRPTRGRLEADVWAFSEALERGDLDRALSLYRGHFLEGFQLPGVPRFERWVDDRRERFRDQAHEAALTAGRAAREAGTLEDATAAFERALELRPLRETAAVALVRTLAEGGRSAEALQRYEVFRERRDEELDLAPSEEFEALVERIRAGEVERPGSGLSEGTTARGPGGETVGEGTAGVGPGGADAGVPLWRRPTGGAVAVLVLAAAALGLWQLAEPGGGTTAPATDSSVAVLPFEAIGTQDPGPIAEGLHSDLLTRLSNVSGLKVISATSVERFRDTDLSLPAVADSLGVEWVVEGDVQRAGGALQVNAQLVDARTDAHVWARAYRRELTAANLFDLQGEITQEIAWSLEAQLTPEETERVERRPTENLDAYRLYVQGRNLLAQRTVPSIREATSYFERALQRDSTYALPWAGLADAHVLRAIYDRGMSADRRETMVRDAKTAAGRARKLDRDLAEAWAALGAVHVYEQRAGFSTKNGPIALRELRRAVALKPSYAHAQQWLAELYLRLGRPQLGLEHASLAVELNPEHAAAREMHIWTLIANDRTDELQRHLQQLTSDAYYNKTLVFYHTGQWDRLEKLARERLEVGGEPALPGAMRTYIARIAALRGDTVSVRQHLDWLRKQDYPAAPIQQGFVNAVLGDYDAAFEAWRSFEGWAESAELPLRYWYPDVLDPLRRDPRFDELIREVNVAWGLNPDGSLPDSVDVSFGSQSDE